MDYRDLHGRFDKIASVGMFEHVGPKNYTAFWNMVRRLLTDDGLMLLHTIYTILRQAPRSLSDLGDRSEQGGRASTEFHDNEAHSGSMQRDSGELWATLPPAQ
jgi:cyclopropane fatty-acyl-phospholipid synthase-like methyltransferase